MPDRLADLANLTRMNKFTRAIWQLPTEARALTTIVRSGMIGPERPDRLLGIYRALERYGTMGAGVSAAAIRYGGRAALVDDLGPLTFVEMDDRSNALANALLRRGIRPEHGVGILCRNHRGLFDATYAVLKLGARVLYLNTDFAAPQLKEVCDREDVELLVYDEEFAETVASVDTPRGRFLAWTDDPRAASEATLGSLITSGDTAAPPAVAGTGKVVILTSGTTGTPKGANRAQPRSLTAAAAILSRIPFRARESTFVATPAFHAWGLGMSALATALGSTIVVQRRFDAARTLDALAQHRCTALTVVPVVLNRLLDLGDERIAGADLSALRIIASSGAQLDAALATRAMDTFGDILYNLYGSTEVAWATIADPSDLRASPGTAGRPPLGTAVRIYDDSGRPAPGGTTGRIFVGSGMEFGGYTGGGGKDVIDGLMSTGDVGHFDGTGRLFVDGRDDEMIVSGGENVFPGEVEEVLAAHQSVVEAAAIGVKDDAFGQRLRAFVVVRDGHSLDADAVKGYVRANLARYKVPRDVVFVDRLPRNPSGKVIKRELAETDRSE